MSSLDRLKAASQKQNPFVVKSRRLRSNAEKDEGSKLWYFYVAVFIDDNENRGNKFISYEDIEYVEYTLHESFPDRYRVSKAREKKFEIQIWTYGFFKVKAKLFTRWGQILEATGKVDFAVSDDEKNNNLGELEW